MADYYLYSLGDTPVTPLSNTNRKFDVGFTKITKEHRLADGSLKRDTIAVKESITISFEYLPSLSADEPDGAMGADDLETLFKASGTLVLRKPIEGGGSFYTEKNMLVAPDGFKKSLLLRFPSGKCYWSTSITLLEC